jgi:hypothetical protein
VAVYCFNDLKIKQVTFADIRTSLGPYFVFGLFKVRFVFGLYRLK